MRRLLAYAALVGALGCAACTIDPRVRLATAMTSHLICSQTFVAGQNPDQVYREMVLSMPGMQRADWALNYAVDPARREVRATAGGVFANRAVYREGQGCVIVPDGAPVAAAGAAAARPPADAAASLLPAVAAPGIVAPVNERLAAAIDGAFAEIAGAPLRRTKAIVVMHNGRIVGERYAAGVGVDTPLLSFSAAKSVVNALIGILAREGRLTVAQRAPIAAWHAAGDARASITIDQLLRHTSGLALTQDYSGFDQASRMHFLERDMAAFAERAPAGAPPGSRWSYSDGNYVILSRIVRDVVGGGAADFVAFARRELFGPLGMASVTIEFDAAGTPMGSSYLYASARDWARFGVLYLDDGAVGGRRILPRDWVRYSATPTPGADLGYGAGFWTNRGNGDGARRRIAAGMPADAFFAGGVLGQYVVVVPSANLVVVRFGISDDWPDFDVEGISRLVGEVITALPPAASRGARRVANRRSP
ncbi:MAG: serine hydrolase [Alphaproteobacteria bacterium]|nr:serine hydrolase [Alphaproteobacteria bacterium]